MYLGRDGSTKMQNGFLIVFLLEGNILGQNPRFHNNDVRCLIHLVKKMKSFRLGYRWIRCTMEAETMHDGMSMIDSQIFSRKAQWLQRCSRSLSISGLHTRNDRGLCPSTASEEHPKSDSLGRDLPIPYFCKKNRHPVLECFSNILIHPWNC